MKNQGVCGSDKGTDRTQSIRQPSFTASGPQAKSDDCEVIARSRKLEDIVHWEGCLKRIPHQDSCAAFYFVHVLSV